MLRCLSALIVISFVSGSAAADAKRLHTHFLFSVTGGKRVWTEAANVATDLGGQDGWSCRASAERTEGALGHTYGTGFLSCVHRPSGVESTLLATCDTQEKNEMNQNVSLKAKNVKLPMVVIIRCETSWE
jgi:hypothetical protein